jgi:hypothetical protein
LLREAQTVTFENRFHRVRVKAAAAAVSAVAITALSVPTIAVSSASAASLMPRLRFIATAASATAPRGGPGGPGGPGTTAYASLPLYMAVDEADLHIRATRASYNEPIVVNQVLANGTKRALPNVVSSFTAGGLEKFFHLSVTDSKGARRADVDLPWCPAAGWNAVRTSPNAPDKNPYPLFCGFHPFTRGQVWGLPAGWAADPALNAEINVPDGTYKATLAINSKFQKLFAVSGPTSHVYNLTVMTPPPPPPPPPMQATPQAAPSAPQGAVTTRPDPATLPNLVALPAYNAITEHNPQTNQDLLDFAATVWNAGPGKLVVDGFRRGQAPIMDAYQSFYKGDTKVGYKRVGTFEYDARPGHEHWHFTDFAAYRLLDAKGKLVLPSAKEAFCLAPTDGIDLTVPGAQWQTESMGFSQCGDVNSIGLREAMPVGWGDTYFQSLPGQSFDITNLPNGTYQIEVVANPVGRLLESTATDNVARRTVTLSGPPGQRVAKMAPYGTIAN